VLAPRSQHIWLVSPQATHLASSALGDSQTVLGAVHRFSEQHRSPTAPQDPQWPSAQVAEMPLPQVLPAATHDELPPTSERTQQPPLAQ